MHILRGLTVTPLLLLLTSGLAHGQHCVVDVVVLNVDREVYGPVAAECSRPHSIPFGNWGAEFPYFRDWRIRDGYQFSGWKTDDGWLQWNSCTTRTDFMPPNPSYYNSGQDDSQVAAPNVVNIVDARRDHIHSGPDGVSCSDLAASQALEIGTAAEPIELKVYELDRRIPFIDGPDHIATLAFGSILVQYVCDDDDVWDCRGESQWIRPTGGADAVYARLKLKVHLHRRR